MTTAIGSPARTKPPSARVPLVLLTGFLVPQLALCAANVRAWMLVGAEADDSARLAALILAICLSLIVAATAIALVWYRNHKPPGTMVLLLSIVSHAGYLWLFLFTVTAALPNTVQPWILHEGDLWRWNVTLLMPGAFLSLHALTKNAFQRPLNLRHRIGLLAILIGAPLLIFLFSRFSLSVLPAFIGNIVVIGGFTVLSILFLGAVIRVFDYLVAVDITDRFSAGHYWIAALLGIAAPLGGLWLNTTIPFPVNFQSTGVYGFAIINGLILLMKPATNTLPRVRLLLRGVAAPFTLYFFLVFLPYLPLSVLAIIVVGAGILMLSPLALGLYQTRVTGIDFAAVAERSGTGQAALLLGLGLAVLPGYFGAQALLDKRAINTAIDYFYSHDMASEPLSDSEQTRSARALISLRDRKSGVQLPYVDSAYDSIVFGNMVLSDRKIEHMYRWLTGKSMQPMQTFASGFGRPRGQRQRAGWLQPPSRDAALQDLAVQQQSDGGATVDLRIENLTEDTHTLFTEQLRIPAGVFVTGLRLKIEGQWVEGKVIDKKTALWVFQKITEVRRDPAVLSYTDTGIAELRVYPFPALGTREVSIDFEYHPELTANVKIGEHDVALNTESGLTAVSTDAGAAIGIDTLRNNRLDRDPYLHFILDYSETSKQSAASYAEQIALVSGDLGIAELRISAANIALSADDQGPVLTAHDTQAIAARIASMDFPQRGGLWVQQALSKEIRRALERTAIHPTARPVFVVLTDKSVETLGQINLSPWRRLLPDLGPWYLFHAGTLITYPSSSTGQPDVASASSVVLLKSADKVQILNANTNSILSASPETALEIYSPLRGSFEPLTLDRATSASTSWRARAKLWSKWRSASANPAALEQARRELLEGAREHSVLLPIASLIVVESASQWEILARKEQQALKNHGALDFEEPSAIPESSPWLIVLLGLTLLHSVRRRSRRDASMAVAT